jgi:aspartyl-tRNA(Asn)/glutamyl-tRNA(Gln) amidotransferase subunit B
MITKEALAKYEPTIGIECHVQLRTKTKLFSGADNDARGKAPNTVVSPICFGLPGTLPVLNREAVNLAVRAGVALNAEIARVSSFDRKHYFYPDLPKGYQITQLERPTVGKGKITIPLKDGSFDVRINRAHIEEDAGKLTHPAGADYSLVDLNRAGTPLIEIVSEADIHSPEQAKAYVQELYLLMKYTGVTDGDLFNGNMRFDINVSAAPKGSDKLGTRAEVKNLNSFRSVERAAQYEFERQVELLERGEKIVQETRGWSDPKQKTFSQRSKEEAMDYRYFPDADLPPIELTDEHIAKIRAEVEPILPGALRQKLQAAGIRQTDAETLLLSDATLGSAYVPTVLSVEKDYGAQVATFTANFVVNRVAGQTGAVKLPSAKQFADVFAIFQDKLLSSNNVDALLLKLGTDHSADAKSLAESEGLLQENNTATLESLVDEVLTDPASAKAVADVKAGNDRVIGYLVGQVMKKSGGKANPAVVSKIIRDKQSARRRANR